MSVRSRVISAAVSAAVIAISGSVVAAPASADTSIALPWQTFADLVADSHGHVYVTGGHGTDGVFVRNSDGSANTTITSQPGASGLALSPDGATLYVALYDGAAISAIDTTTLTETRRYAVPSACPEHVTVVGGGLWFDTTCDHQSGTLSSADLVTGVVHVGLEVGSPGFFLPVPGDPSGLLVADVGIIPGNVRRYTISGGTLTQVGVSAWCSPFTSMAIDPDGAHVVVACGNALEHQRLNIGDLATVGSYASGSSPDGVATSTALDGVVAAGVNGVAGPDVYVYRAGTLVRAIDFAPNDELLPDGLAWAPDGGRLYAVTLTHSLQVIDAPTTAPSTLTVSGPTTVMLDTGVNLSGSLSTSAGPVVGAVLSVTRSDSSGTTPLPHATTASDGSYSVPDTVGNSDATYTVSYAGDATHTARQATTKILVLKNPSALTVVAPTTGTRGVAYTVSGVLSASGVALAGATVALKRTDLAGTRTVSLKTTASGGYSYRDVPAVGGPVTWAATWAGDATRRSASARRTVTIARATTSLSIRSSASTYSYGAKATVAVHLGTTYNRRDVYVYARPLGTSVTAPGTLIAHVTVNSAGNAVVSSVVKRRTTFTVRFAGDYRYNATARAVSPYVRAGVAVTLTGYYGKSGSTFLFHGTEPMETISVAPARAAGSCFNTLVQAYLGNTWQFISSLTCGYLDATSHGYAAFGINRPRGVPVRIRASVPDNLATQTLGATSAWVYLKFA